MCWQYDFSHQCERKGKPDSQWLPLLCWFNLPTGHKSFRDQNLLIFQEMPVVLCCFVGKNFMGNLPNIKVQLEGRTHFFKAKNLKDKLFTELYYLKTTTTTNHHHHQKKQNKMKKPNQPTNQPPLKPTKHTHIKRQGRTRWSYKLWMDTFSAFKLLSVLLSLLVVLSLL